MTGNNVIEDSYPGRQDEDALPHENAAGFDQRVPNAARIYDWLIGGKDHYAADRAVGRRLAAAIPGIRQAAADNRAFLARVTRYLAAEAGISQFIDIGSGLPGPGPVHEIAREAQPAVRVVYVDHDPVVVAHARALLADHPRTGPSKVTAVEADLRYPRNMLTVREIRDTIDLTQPVAVLLIAVLHFIPTTPTPMASSRPSPLAWPRAATWPCPTAPPTTWTRAPRQPPALPTTAHPCPAFPAAATRSSGSSTDWTPFRPASQT
jgi:S-adenosyl methyltransferase